MMNDFISRQAAIDALEREKTYSTVYRDGYTQTDYFKQYNMGLTDGIKALNKLPSAQSERDCVDLSERVTATFYDEEYEEWSQKTVTIRDVLDSVCDEYTILPSAQPEQRWVPCSKRLPRQGQEVICQCRANMIKVLKLDACGDWYQDAEHCYMSGFVIAWMPLPEPYAEGRTDG